MITLTVSASDRLVTFPGNYDYGNPFQLPQTIGGFSGALGAYKVQRKIRVDVRIFYWYEYLHTAFGWLPCNYPLEHNAVNHEELTSYWHYFYYPALVANQNPWSGYACTVNVAQTYINAWVLREYGDKDRTEYDCRRFDPGNGELHRENQDISWGWADEGNSRFDKL